MHRSRGNHPTLRSHPGPPTSHTSARAQACPLRPQATSLCGWARPIATIGRPERRLHPQRPCAGAMTAHWTRLPSPAPTTPWVARPSSARPIRRPTRSCRPSTSNRSRTKIYGWFNGGFNVSSSNKGDAANSPAAYYYSPNRIVPDQQVLYIERLPDTVQTDHVDYGFRLAQLYGQDYRYTTTKGILFAATACAQPRVRLRPGDVLLRPLHSSCG